jgi:hypothetical protein
MKIFVGIKFYIFFKVYSCQTKNIIFYAPKRVTRYASIMPSVVTYLYFKKCMPHK